MSLGRQRLYDAIKAAHLVGLGDLRVMVFADGPNEWYAQGLEIDYLAQGSDLKTVKAAFERGLRETITEHLRAYGDIKKLLQVAEAGVWEEFYARATIGCYYHSQVTFHALESPAQNTVLLAVSEQKASKKVQRRSKPRAVAPSGQSVLPFRNLSFYEPAEH